MKSYKQRGGLACGLTACTLVEDAYKDTSAVKSYMNSFSNDMPGRDRGDII